MSIISVDPSTNSTPIVAALQSVLAKKNNDTTDPKKTDVTNDVTNDDTTDQKRKIDEALTALIDVKTPFPKRQSDFQAFLSEFLKENGTAVVESVEVNGYGPLKFYIEALNFVSEKIQ